MSPPRWGRRTASPHERLRVLRDVLLALAEEGVAVEQFHPEYAAERAGVVARSRCMLRIPVLVAPRSGRSG
jgi:hypothetical protein